MKPRVGLPLWRKSMLVFAAITLPLAWGPFICPVRAAPPPFVEQSKAHLREGNQFYKAGQYKEATEAYLKSYKLVPRSILLFNIAQGHRLGGNQEEAQHYYEMFLTAQPTGPGTAEARRYLNMFEQERIVKEKRLAEEKRPAEEKGQGDAAAARPQATTNPALLPASMMADAPSPGRGLRWAGTIVTLAGIGAVTVGVLKYLSASSQSSDIASTRAWTDADLMRLAGTTESGQADANLAYILLGAGGGLIATGGILYYFGVRAAINHVAIVPTVGRDLAGVAAVGKF